MDNCIPIFEGIESTGVEMWRKRSESSADDCARSGARISSEGVCELYQFVFRSALFLHTSTDCSHSFQCCHIGTDSSLSAKESSTVSNRIIHSTPTPPVVLSRGATHSLLVFPCGRMLLLLSFMLDGDSKIMTRRSPVTSRIRHTLWDSMAWFHLFFCFIGKVDQIFFAFQTFCGVVVPHLSFFAASSSNTKVEMPPNCLSNFSSLSCLGGVPPSASLSTYLWPVRRIGRVLPWNSLRRKEELILSGLDDTLLLEFVVLVRPRCNVLPGRPTSWLPRGCADRVWRIRPRTQLAAPSCLTSLATTCCSVHPSP